MIKSKNKKAISLFFIEFVKIYKRRKYKMFTKHFKNTIITGQRRQSGNEIAYILPYYSK